MRMKQLNIPIPHELIKALKRRAVDEEIPLKTLVIKILAESLEATDDN